MLGLASGDMQYLLGRFDQTAATFALEQRYPFFDRRFMEFCLALPFEQKLRQGWTRAIFRRAMEKVLPPKVQWRTDKGNMSVNIRRRLLEERETLDAVILHDPEDHRGVCRYAGSASCLPSIFISTDAFHKRGGSLHHLSRSHFSSLAASIRALPSKN